MEEFVQAAAQCPVPEAWCPKPGAWFGRVLTTAPHAVLCYIRLQPWTHSPAAGQAGRQAGAGGCSGAPPRTAESWGLVSGLLSLPHSLVATWHMSELVYGPPSHYSHRWPPGTWCAGHHGSGHTATAGPRSITMVRSLTRPYTTYSKGA